MSQPHTSPQNVIEEKTKDAVVSNPIRRQRASLSQRLLRVYIAVMAIAVIFLTVFAKTTPYFPLDLIITRAVQSISLPGFSSLMNFVSWWGFGIQSFLIVPAVAVILYLFGMKIESAMTFFVGVSQVLVTLLIKGIIRRDRPSIDLVHVARHLNDYSFPSGHVLMYTAFGGFLIYLTYIFIKDRILRIGLIAFIGMLILLVGPSRIYLGQHWASDTLGGYLFGSIWLYLMIRVYHKVRIKWGKQQVV